MNSDLQKLFEILKQTMENALNKKSIGFKSSIYRNDLEPTECEITKICEHSWLFDFLISEENLHNVMHFRCKNLYWSISGRIYNFKKLDKLKIKLIITLDINELILFDKFSDQISYLKLIYSKIYSNVLNDILSLESLEYLAFSDTKIVMNNNASFSTFNYSIKYFEYHGSLFHNFYMIFEFIRMLVNIKTVVLNLTEDFVPLRYEEKFIPIKKIENLIYKNFNAQINHSSAINQFIATNKLSLCFQTKYEFLRDIFCENNFDTIEYLEVENILCRIYDKNILANLNQLKEICFKKIKLQGLSLCDLFDQTMNYNIFSVALWNIFISDNDIRFLNNLNKLIHLKFYDCMFNSHLIECIGKCSFPNLKYLLLRISEDTVIPEYVLYLKEIFPVGILSIE
ncbi:hypothetical protein LUQ84_001717 [Hamiltosporidium tvaerminnensis]|nr:hypothetical protein LUQ84_001717 [Hamiltosporidium tvaerminnensis]